MILPVHYDCLQYHLLFLYSVQGTFRRLLTDLTSMINYSLNLRVKLFFGDAMSSLFYYVHISDLDFLCISFRLNPYFLDLWIFLEVWYMDIKFLGVSPYLFSC